MVLPVSIRSLDKSALYEVLSNEVALPNKVLSTVRFMMRSGTIDIESGEYLPLIKSIGNANLSKILIETGKINYYRRDAKGQTPVHKAGELQDRSVLENMAKMGADLSIPDSKGNTVLHYICQGPVRDEQFALIKWLVGVKGLRLIRNNDSEGHETPLNIIQSTAANKFHS